MFSFGANNWIKYGWGPNLKENWEVSDVLTVDVSKATNLVEKYSPFDAAQLTIEHIAKNYPPPYNIMCSGGIDSQSMLWAWHMSGVPFNVVSVKYISNDRWFNQHDLVTLEEFANNYGIKVTYSTFDILNFLENDLQETARRFDCSSPQISTHIKMCENLTGTVIYGGNYISSARVHFNYAILGLHRSSVQLDSASRKIIPFFFVHTPELAVSFDQILKRKDGYLKAGFPILTKTEKFTGFELIKEYYDKYNERIAPKVKLMFANKPSNRSFDLMFRYPYEGMNPCRESALCVVKS